MVADELISRLLGFAPQSMSQGSPSLHELANMTPDQVKAFWGSTPAPSPNPLVANDPNWQAGDGLDSEYTGALIQKLQRERAAAQIGQDNAQLDAQMGQWAPGQYRLSPDDPTGLAQRAAILSRLAGEQQPMERAPADPVAVADARTRMAERIAAKGGGNMINANMGAQTSPIGLDTSEQAKADRAAARQRRDRRETETAARVQKYQQQMGMGGGGGGVNPWLAVYYPEAYSAIAGAQNDTAKIGVAQQQMTAQLEQERNQHAERMAAVEADKQRSEQQFKESMAAGDRRAAEAAAQHTATLQQMQTDSAERLAALTAQIEEIKARNKIAEGELALKAKPPVDPAVAAAIENDKTDRAQKAKEALVDRLTNPLGKALNIGQAENIADLPEAERKAAILSSVVDNAAAPESGSWLPYAGMLAGPAGFIAGSMMDTRSKKKRVAKDIVKKGVADRKQASRLADENVPWWYGYPGSSLLQ